MRDFLCSYIAIYHLKAGKVLPAIAMCVAGHVWSFTGAAVQTFSNILV